MRVCDFLTVIVLCWHSLLFAPRVAADEASEEQTQLGNLETSKSNLINITTAMGAYHDTTKKFPAAYLMHDGKPTLSWRVAILPYLYDDACTILYQQFHLDEPWDSEHNKQFVKKMPRIYQSPTSQWKDGRTVYLVPTGAGTLFDGSEGVNARKVTDGTQRTFAVLEYDDDHAVQWTKPVDLPFDPVRPMRGLRGLYRGKFLAATVGATVHEVPITIKEKKLKTFFTISGRETEVLDDMHFPSSRKGLY